MISIFLAGEGRGDVDVPLDSWVYRALDRLQASGLVESGSLSSRPISRREAARLTVEARRRTAERGEKRYDGAIRRLEQEFSAEIRDMDNHTRTSYLRPLDEVRAEGLFRDDASDPYNDRGRESRDGLNTRMSASSRAEWGPFSGYLRWEGQHLPQDGAEPEDASGRVDEGYGRISLGNWNLTAGREALWWGPGRHGSLLLSDNARPFDLLRFGNDQPVLLPWLMERLGPIRVETFLTRLEGDREGPEHPYLAGMRMTIMPLPYLELGASRVAMFGGSGRPVDWQTGRDIMTGRGENEPAGPGDQLASLDCRLTVPWSAQPFQLYGELGGEDMAGFFFSRQAYLAGVYLPRLGPASLLDLRVEFADTDYSRREGYPRTWYTHGTYTEGYTYDDRFIGHHAGTDAQDLYAEVGVYVRDDLRLWVAADRERRELSLEHPEMATEYSLGAEWTPWERLTVSLAFTREETNNFEFVSGQDRTGNRIFAGVTWRF